MKPGSTCGALLHAQRHHGIDLRRPPRGQVGRGRPDRQQEQSDARQRRDVSRLDTEQKAGQKRRQQPRRREPDGQADEHQLQSLADVQPEDVAARGAERHAHADLAVALRHVVGEHAVDADDGERERERLVALGGPPKCPAWDEHHLYAVVLLYETGDALTTFQKNWEACVHVHGESRTWKWDSLVMTPKGVRPREGAKPRKPGLRWAVAELGRAYQGITVRDARVAQSAEESAGMGQELPLIAALHPRWATSMNGETIPFVDAPDLEIAPDGEGKFYCAPCLHFDRDRGLGLGRVGLGACNVGNPNRGFGSGSLQ